MGWEPTEYVNLYPLLMRPVEEGYWKLYETFDGTYNIDDLFDILEVIQVKSENAARAKLHEMRSRNV